MCPGGGDSTPDWLGLMGGIDALRPRIRLRRCASPTAVENPYPRREKQKRLLRGAFFAFLAERVGFEPTKGYKPLLVFKTSAFNRSATSPNLSTALPPLHATAHFARPMAPFQLE